MGWGDNMSQKTRMPISNMNQIVEKERSSINQKHGSEI
jgi:hypothetical protein